jgi:hypothetical protein
MLILARGELQTEASLFQSDPLLCTPATIASASILITYRAEHHLTTWSIVAIKTGCMYGAVSRFPQQS